MTLSLVVIIRIVDSEFWLALSVDAGMKLAGIH